MLEQLFIFVAATYTIFRWATMSTRYAGDLARSFHLSKFIVGFLVVAVISILPETFVAIDTALKGIPDYGLATLFGSNVADLTLVFAIVIYYAQRSLKVWSKVLKHHILYPFILLLPLVLGFNGHFTRLDGVALILAGCIFYYLTLRDENADAAAFHAKSHDKMKNFLMLLVSMWVLLIGAHFMIESSLGIAEFLWLNSIVVGMLVVGLGTTVPELFFAVESVKKDDDSLAIGDILGTVLADATIVVGIIALIAPFSFPVKIIYFTGVFMLTAACILFYLMKTGRMLTKKDANILLLFWIFFAAVELYISK